MKLSLTKFSLIGAALIAIGVMSCKDDFTEEDLIAQQQQAQKEELQAAMEQDSLAYLIQLSEIEYNRYLDSLSRADSIAVAQLGMEAYLPYTYEVLVINGSNKATNNGGSRTDAFDADVTVTITQYGVKQTQTSTDGLFTFSNIGVGLINGTIEAPGHTSFEFQVDASLGYNFFKEVVEELAGGTGGTGGAGGGTGGTGGTGSTYLQNQYILQAMLNYFNQRSFGNAFPIFATEGPQAGTVMGRAYIETDLTNRTKEVVPEGTPIVAFIDVDDSDFEDQYNLDPDGSDDNTGNIDNEYDEGDELLNSIFVPRSWGLGWMGQATTDANGDYVMTVPGSAGTSDDDDGLPLVFEYSDVVADKTYYLQTNGDVTEIVRRTLYGPNANETNMSAITLAPTVTFDAGSGATATAFVAGDGSITAIEVTNGGQNFQGTPRVLIAAPPAGGTQATATATVVNGVVTDIAIVNAGAGYTGAPAITITEGSGGAASVSANIFDGTNGGIADVIVTNAGVNYQSAPNVIFHYGALTTTNALNATNFPAGSTQGGITTSDFPAATATVNAGTVSVGNIAVTASGSNLGVVPNVSVTSGIGAQVTVDTDAAGIITAVTVVDGGAYYTDAPTLDLSGLGTPTTAAQLAVTVTAGVVNVTITNGGTGYTANLVGQAIGVNAIGSGATATAVWQGFGVGGVQIDNEGNPGADNLYYTNAPAVIFDAPDYSGAGSLRAEGTAVLGSDGRLIAINVTTAGSGYTAFPAVTLVSGNGATATARFGNQTLTQISVNAQGSGYIVAPQVIIVDAAGNGSGATATANIQDGRLISIDITNAGSGYISAPTVIILDPGTSYDAEALTRYANPALANVIVEDGVVTLVEIYQNGDSYPDGTRVEFTSNKGNGVSATATVVNGEIVDVVVDNGGTGYVGSNYWRTAGALNNPDVQGSTSGQLTFNSYFGAPTGYYNSISGVTKVNDIEYGTGEHRD